MFVAEGFNIVFAERFAECVREQSFGVPVLDKMNRFLGELLCLFLKHCLDY